MANKKTFIIKVQASQHPYHEEFLTYNQDRSIHFNSVFDQKFFDEMMGTDEKAYFKAETKPTNIIGADALNIIERTDEQDW